MSDRRKLQYMEYDGDDDTEFDGHDYPHWFCDPDGVPLVLVTDYFDEGTLDKIRAFFEGLEYGHAG